MTSERLYSLAEAAAALGISREAARLRIKRGDMAALRVGVAGWAVSHTEIARQRALAYRPGRKPRHQHN